MVHDFPISNLGFSCHSFHIPTEYLSLKKINLGFSNQEEKQVQGKWSYESYGFQTGIVQGFQGFQCGLQDFGLFTWPCLRDLGL